MMKYRGTMENSPVGRYFIISESEEIRYEK